MPWKASQQQILLRGLKNADIVYDRWNCYNLDTYTGQWHNTAWTNYWTNTWSRLTVDNSFAFPFRFTNTEPNHDRGDASTNWGHVIRLVRI